MEKEWFAFCQTQGKILYVNYLQKIITEYTMDLWVCGSFTEQ